MSTIEQQAIKRVLEVIEALEDMDLPEMPLHWNSRHVEVVMFSLDKIRALMDSVVEEV